MTNNEVHRTHCCVLHGCKYLDDNNCPLVNKEINQLYPCMDCPASLSEAYEKVNQKYNDYLMSVKELELVKTLIKGD